MSAEADVEARSRLLAALAAGATIAAAAKTAGYSYRQAHRLAHDPVIVAEVARIKEKAPPEHPDVVAAKARLRRIVDRLEEGSPQELSVVAQACKALIAAHQSGARKPATKPASAPQEPAAPAGEALTPEQAQERIRMLA